MPASILSSPSRASSTRRCCLSLGPAPETLPARRGAGSGPVCRGKAGRERKGKGRRERGLGGRERQARSPRPGPLPVTRPAPHAPIPPPGGLGGPQPCPSPRPCPPRRLLWAAGLFVSFHVLSFGNRLSGREGILTRTGMPGLGWGEGGLFVLISRHPGGRAQVCRDTDVGSSGGRGFREEERPRAPSGPASFQCRPRVF